jgi:hypothetical protein
VSVQTGPWLWLILMEYKSGATKGCTGLPLPAAAVGIKGKNPSSGSTPAPLTQLALDLLQVHPQSHGQLLARATLHTAVLTLAATRNPATAFRRGDSARPRATR